MTQCSANHFGRRHGGERASELPAASPVICPEELDKLLGRVRQHAVLFVEVLKNDGEPVEYGEKLFAVAVVGAAGRAEQSCSARC